MYDIVALGELLIDFTPAGTSEMGNVLFERNPGGAPANVLAAVAKLGGRPAFIGKVGDDNFGRFLTDMLKNANIDTRGMVISKDTNTTLAFVHLRDDGDRSFSFYRNPGADMMLKEEEVDLGLIENAKVFHFGSISMTHEPVKSATFKALEHAKKSNILISYDPNLRPPLWDSLEKARLSMLEGMKYADILKISEEELEFLTDIKDIEEGSKFLMDNYDLKWVFVTLGPKGCHYRTRKYVGSHGGYVVKAVDTTGSGDSFLGSVIHSIVTDGRDLDEFSASDLEAIVDCANATGALVATKRGAIPSMPSISEIKGFIEKYKK